MQIRTSMDENQSFHLRILSKLGPETTLVMLQVSSYTKSGFIQLQKNTNTKIHK